MRHPRRHMVALGLMLAQALGGAMMLGGVRWGRALGKRGAVMLRARALGARRGWGSD